jgi:predicted O-linked N-acetylglucosamine transferase (SPINDLY family)
MSAPNRNDPCPCGSGKKYKQCCLKGDENIVLSKRSDVDKISRLIQEAIKLHQSGHLPQAEALYQQILKIEPNNSEALNLLGVIAHQVGRDEIAVELIKMAIRLKPSAPSYYSNLGSALQGLGKLDEARNNYHKALLLQPDLVEAQNNLGNVLRDQGKNDEAIDHFRKALKLKPDYAEVHNNLGLLLLTLNRLPLAIEHLQKALKHNPAYAEAHNSLGLALQAQGKIDEAIECFRTSVTLVPEYVQPYSNMGNVFREQGKLEKAVEQYCKALAIKPDYAEAHCNIGVVFQEQGRLIEAIEHYRKAVILKPDFAGAYSGLLFALNFRPDLSREEVFRAAGEYEAQFGMPLQSAWRIHDNDKNPARRLRIGYVSPDFRRHAVATFMEPILASHDKSQVEIYCYAEVPQEDEVTARFKLMSDHWHSTVGLSDEAVADMIRDHRIDILVDLAGHTAKNRLLIFARKPAPIQLTYLGYPGTTGLTAMDYRITDYYTEPEGLADAFYSEKLLRLPHSLWCYRPSVDMPETSVLPALTRGYITFGSFNNFNKVDQPTMDLWAELLRTLPTARLMMLTVPEGETRQRLEHRFAELGITSGRLEFQGKLPAAEFHRKFLEVDITLDPVTVNGATTTCESLWMGVPVMSLVGTRFLTRAGLSVLSAAGLTDFAAASREDYFRLAIHLADNLPLLAEIRAGLRAHLHTSPLVDEVGFTRNLENLYRDTWGKWCSAEGSGKKYKKCCLKIADISASANLAPSLLISGALQEAIEHHQSGRLPQAETLYQKILQVEPKHPEALHLLGVIAHQTGRNETAVELIGKAIKVDPSIPYYYSNLGSALQAQGKLEAAADSYRHALKLKPDYAEAHNNLGTALKEQDLMEAAVEHYLKALTIMPNYTEAHNNLGICLYGMGRLNEAVASYRQALLIMPDYAEAHFNLGITFNTLGKLVEAEASYRRATQINPEYADALNNLGDTLSNLGHLDEAEVCCRRALRIKPDYPGAHINLGNVLKNRGRLDEAEAIYRQALIIKPDFADAYLSLGRVFFSRGDIEAALVSFSKALLIQPDSQIARCNLGEAQLACGKLAEGWENHEFRLGVDDNNEKRFTHRPYWAGENLDGKSILVWGEQGIGDEIMFASMFSEIIARARHCVIECASKLVPLFTRSFPDALIVPRSDPPHPATQAGIDYQCAAGSLARWLRPGLESFPKQNTFLIPDPERAAYWRARLEELGPGPKIGFSWRSKLIVGERNLQYTMLDQWGPIFTLQGLHFVNLQYDGCSDELNEAQQRFGVPLHAFTEVDMFNDLDETAALIKALDLVIAPNAVFSLSAAIGVNAWVMSCGDSWNSHGTDYVPWYPALRYFNRRWDQPWDEIIERVSKQLKLYVEYDGNR